MDTRTKTTTTGTLIVVRETSPNCQLSALFGITREHKNLRRENTEDEDGMGGDNVDKAAWTEAISDPYPWY